MVKLMHLLYLYFKTTFVAGNEIQHIFILLIYFNEHCYKWVKQYIINCN